MYDLENYKGLACDIKNKIDNLDYYESISNNYKELFKKYKDTCGKYEVEFKKDTNDNWYWYSTTKVR